MIWSRAMVLDKIRHPIVQAPMAGGPSTVELASAVGNTGGLGFLAGGYLPAATLRDQIRELRDATDAPFGVNVFIPGRPTADRDDLAAYIAALDEPAEPRYDDDGWPEKLAILVDERPAIASFAFGCPAAGDVSDLRRAGVETWVTVTSAAEANVAETAGAAALVVQGCEAGGHRGGFDDTIEPVGLLALLRLVAAATRLPLIATGGVMDAEGVAAALAAGATVAQAGTAFMLAPEAATNPAHRARLGTDAPTALTRAFTGRLARGIVNAFMEEHPDAPRAYPEIHHATAPIRAAARKRGDADNFNLWAGQGHALAREQPAGEIVERLAGRR
jgi:nitronate monooxygenase